MPPKPKAKGTAFEIKWFPDSKPGKNGPFNMPPNAPPSGDFPAWADYFATVVGAKLESLNGLQFELDQTGQPARLNKMSDELADLAEKLGMNRAGTISNPPDLSWPLTGVHDIAWSPQAAGDIGFKMLVLKVTFESEPDYQMVVNSTIVVQAQALGPGMGESSSSSYLATSSSG